MKKHIEKYWPYVYAVIVIVYETQAELLDNQFIPVWVKTFLGVVAAVGLILKRLPRNEKPG